MEVETEGPTTNADKKNADPGSAQLSKGSRRAGCRKQRGLTCANCRARKVRCEGSQPTCKTCEAYNEKRRYDRLPPMSQILAMAKRLEEAEQTIADLLRSPGKDSINGRSFHVTDHVVEDQTHGKKESEAATSENVLPDLSLDQNGKLCFYGPTSAVHDPPALAVELAQAQNHVNTMIKPEVRASLVAKANESKAWEEFAIESVALQSKIPGQVISKLLNIHWTWVSPMFMWVYRPAFIYDMATGGGYYSEFLLMVLCGHAARFYDTQLADMLISKARLLLGNAIHQPSSIPTVQALLQLSARDLAFGSISQAWLYSGMAFRMACDLGLHHSDPANPSLRDLNLVDVEVRRRLFWSCYFWDKAISLYTGRMPALIEVADSATLEFLDDSSESETWSPFCADWLNMTKLAPGQYPARKGHYVSCFRNSCKLAIIINDIITSLYSRRRVSQVGETLERIITRLRVWRVESPAYLKCEPEDLPQICPLPHIISQNLMFYTSVILARRPIWNIPEHHQACVSAAQKIEKLLLLIEETYGFENITYLMAYCVYTGASALLRDAKAGNIDAISKLQTFTRALRTGLKKCAILRRSLDIIEKDLNTVAGQRSQSNNFQSLAEGLSDNSFIPAFPYSAYPGTSTCDMAGYSGSVNATTFALDGFPEVQGWYPS